jgi:hypothetical protein
MRVIEESRVARTVSSTGLIDPARFFETSHAPEDKDPQANYRNPASAFGSMTVQPVYS